jgi:hypothetical protein
MDISKANVNNLAEYADSPALCFYIKIDENTERCFLPRLWFFLNYVKLELDDSGKWSKAVLLPTIVQ